MKCASIAVSLAILVSACGGLGAPLGPLSLGARYTLSGAILETTLTGRWSASINLPAKLLDAMGDRPSRRRVFPEPQRMQQFMNNGGLNFSNVSARRTLEIAAA